MEDAIRLGLDAEGREKLGYTAQDDSQDSRQEAK